MAVGGTLTQCPAWCRNKTRDGASDYTDKRSGAGRGVPNYRVLVLVACLSNPLFGIAVYLLNKAAVRNFRDGAKEKAQRLYLATFIVGAASVVVTVTSVVEVIVWAALTPDLQGPHCGVAGNMSEVSYSR